MTAEAEFERECAAAGVPVLERDRQLVFELWLENRERRTALRNQSFDLAEPSFQTPVDEDPAEAIDFAPTQATDEEVFWKPASELAGLLDRKEIGSRELCDLLLARIDRYDPVLNAFESINPDRARAAADTADAARSRGQVAGPLHGLPFGVKSFAAAEGFPHTAGSQSRASIIAARDSSIVANLKSAGAVHFGQCRTHEFGAGMATKEGPSATGRNPWNIEHIPGGSSSGSAVAVSSGMVPGAIGTDSAGSIRMPAGNCGIVGLKPTFGLLPSDGILPYAWSLDTPGSLTRTVTDAAMFLEGMLGKQSPHGYSGGLDRGLKGRVIGVPRAYFWDRDDVREDVRLACEAVLPVLEASGAILKNVEIEGIAWNDAIYTSLLAETWSVHRGGITANPDQYNDWFRAHAVAGGIASASDVIAAQRMRARLASEFQAVFRDVELLVLPGQAVPATEFSNSFATALTQPRSQFMRPFNVTGLPAIAIPCGFSKDGFPLGINFAGPAFGERTLFEISYGYERETEYWRQHPDASAWEK